LIEKKRFHFFFFVLAAARLSEFFSTSGWRASYSAAATPKERVCGCLLVSSFPFLGEILDLTFATRAPAFVQASLT